MLIFEERIGQIPTCKLQLLTNNPCNGYFFRDCKVLLVKFLQNILHLLIWSDLKDANLFELAKRFLHSFIEANIFRSDQMLTFGRYFMMYFIIFPIARTSIARFQCFPQWILSFSFEAQFKLIQIDLPIFFDLLHDESPFIAQLKISVLPWTWAVHSFAGLDLTRSIDMIDSPDNPSFPLSNQEKISAGWLFLDDRDNPKVAFHNDGAWSFRNSNNLSKIESWLPIKLFPILSKLLPNYLSPQRWMFPIAKVCGHEFVSILFHIFKTWGFKYFLPHLLQYFWIVDLNKHSFAHSYIAHQNGCFFYVFDDDELPFGTGYILFSAEFIIAFLHLSIYDQSIWSGFSHFFNVNLDLYFLCEVLWKVENATMVVVKYIFFKGEFNKFKFRSYLWMFDRFLGNASNLQINEVFNGHLLLLTLVVVESRSLAGRQLTELVLSSGDERIFRSFFIGFSYPLFDLILLHEFGLSGENCM